MRTNKDECTWINLRVEQFWGWSTTQHPGKQQLEELLWHLRGSLLFSAALNHAELPLVSSPNPSGKAIFEGSHFYSEG
ncbi:unnamed protein product [Dicrocoelium dendriticum]|nr:unnamed protein product [Dicrocoelium dendriticum]